jgi:hypothetical protein
MTDDEIIAMLKEMIQEWEATLGEEDKTLYSLGLRRAVDRILKTREDRRNG